MTSGDFDFFGAPTTPPPTGPATAGQFGAPAANQFGMPAAAPATNQFGMPTAAPATNQFGLPATAPVRPTVPVQPAQTGRQVVLIAGAIAAVALVFGGFVWLQGQGQKTATKVATTVEGPIVRAHQTEETIDLQQAGQAQEAYLAEHSAYATSVSALTGFVASPTTTITVVSATATAYCLRADDTSTFHAPSMYLSSAVSGATKTPCT